MGNDGDYRKQVGINYHPMTVKLKHKKAKQSRKHNRKQKQQSKVSDQLPVFFPVILAVIFPVNHSTSSERDGHVPR